MQFSRRGTLASLMTLVTKALFSESTEYIKDPMITWAKHWTTQNRKKAKHVLLNVIRWYCQEVINISWTIIDTSAKANIHTIDLSEIKAMREWTSGQRTRRQALASEKKSNYQLTGSWTWEIYSKCVRAKRKAVQTASKEYKIVLIKRR